jgi:hypothetical protein
VSTDDTIDTSGQGRETALLAMAEAGMLPGVRQLQADDVPDPSTLVLYRVPVDACHVGGGLDAAPDLLRLADQGHAGRIMLAFDGWAGDRRALAEVPQVALFCAALLLGPDGLGHQPGRQPPASVAHTSRVLAALLDERKLQPVLGDLAWQATGGAWLVAHAWADLCFARGGATGLLRDLDRNLDLLDAVRQGVRLPGAGRALR